LENQSMLERLSGSTFHLELEERDELKRVSWRRQRQDKPEYNGTKVSGHMAGGCEADNDEERNHGSTRAVPLTDVPPRQGMSSVSSAILYSENLDDIDVPDWRYAQPVNLFCKQGLLCGHLSLLLYKSQKHGCGCTVQLP